MRGKKLILMILAVAALAFGSFSCGGSSQYPQQVSEALDAAGTNRTELIRVIDHYRESNDSLKLQAAYYLIGNMDGHCYVTYGLYDSAGTEVLVDIDDFETYDALVDSLDGIEKVSGEIDYKSLDKIYDLEHITADFLISQIDNAFLAWREKPWAQAYPYETFRNYILPYRGSNEPLEDWRSPFLHMYDTMTVHMQNPRDVIDAASLINGDLRTWFTFDPRYYYHPTDQGLGEMQQSGKGRCEDMTNLTIYALRANGIAVTSDYTPYWANTGNNHAWNAIVMPDGKAIPFMGAEADPGKYRLANKFAKIYRKSFAKQPDNLVFRDRRQDAIPRWLAGKSYIDVTAAYSDVCDVTVRFDQAVPDSIDIAYLCVFNSGNWCPIHWGRIREGEAVFTDMAPGVVYLPALYINEDIVGYAAPFVLNEDCTTPPLIADATQPQPVQLVSTTQRTQEVSTDGIARSYLTPGQQYELQYWNDGWQSLGMKAAGSRSLKFDDVPRGALLWLIAVDGDREERIFTVQHGSQIWW